MNNSDATEIINIQLHVLILFIFLTLFFFDFMAIQEKASIRKKINKLVKEETEQILKTVDLWDKKFSGGGGNINWSKLNDIANEIETKYTGEVPKIKEHDKNLFYISIVIIVILIVIFICTSIYFGWYNYSQINFKKIFVENFIIISITASMELLFFQFIARKYVAVGPDFVAKVIINRLQKHINTQ
jgi:hypothetical protein